MNENAKTMSRVQRMTLLALLTAIVVVLQLLGSFIRFGQFSISLVLVPIVLGAAMLGVGAGAWLGLVFGVTVLMSGDAAAFFAISAVGTVVTVLAKGILAGFTAGGVYKLLEKKSVLAATIAAAVVCPVVNTGIFFLGCLLFFLDAIAEMAAGAGPRAFAFILFVYIGGNVLFELLFNVVLAPVILRLVAVGRKMVARKKA